MPKAELKEVREYIYAGVLSTPRNNSVGYNNLRIIHLH